MKKVIGAGLLAAALSAQAAGDEMGEIKRQTDALRMKLDTCTVIVQTVFVMLRIKANTAEEVKRAGECVEDGKQAAKAGHAQIRAAFGKQKPPEQLADWRLEWASAFDAATLQPSDTERAYLQRVAAARQVADRAYNKLEMALE